MGVRRGAMSGHLKADWPASSAAGAVAAGEALGHAAYFHARGLAAGAERVREVQFHALSGPSYLRVN